MNRCSRLLILIAALACSGEPEQETDPLLEEDPDGRARLRVEELPPTPEYPTPRAGRLVTVSAGDQEINGDWAAHGGLCEREGILEVYAGVPGFTTAVVVRMTDGNRVGTYPIVAATEDPPVPPVSLLAVQIFDEPTAAYGFQAFAGELEITELDRHVTGRFTSTLREVREDYFTHYVGVFEDIPVDVLSMEYCMTLQESTVIDTTESSGQAGTGGD